MKYVSNLTRPRCILGGIDRSVVRGPWMGIQVRVLTKCVVSRDIPTYPIGVIRL